MKRRFRQNHNKHRLRNQRIRLARAQRDHSAYADGLCSCGRRLGSESSWRDHAGAMRRALERVSKQKTERGGSTDTVRRWMVERDAAPKSSEHRLALLRRWSEVVVRDSRTAETRRNAYLRLHRCATLGPCWACQNHDILITHHVIQIQNGGNSWEHNLLRICETCHAEVHPWLKNDIGAPVWERRLPQSVEPYRATSQFVVLAPKPPRPSNICSTDAPRLVKRQPAILHCRVSD